MSNLAKIDQVTNLHRNNELQLLCFRLEKDKDLYAVNVFKIREVVKYRGNITVVSHESSSLVEGLITIRELTIPLIDMRKWFHYDSRMKEKNLKEYAIKREEGEDDIIMICEFSRWTVGVRIYEADRILNKKWTEIEQSAGIGGATQNSKLVSRTRYFMVRWCRWSILKRCSWMFSLGLRAKKRKRCARFASSTRPKRFFLLMIPPAS